MGITNRMLAEAQLSSFVSRMLRPAAQETRARTEAKDFHMVDVRRGRAAGREANRRTFGRHLEVLFVLGGGSAQSNCN